MTAIDGDVHRGWHRGHGLGQDGRAPANIAGRDQVSNVDNPDGRGDPGRHAVTGGNEAILETEVGEEREATRRRHKS